MNEIVRAIKASLRHELLQAQEFIANELSRLDDRRDLEGLRRIAEAISPPPNWGNGEERCVPRYDTGNDKGEAHELSNG